MLDTRKMNLSGLALLFVAATGASLAAGKSYYIDCSGGRDSASGVTQADAWRHHPYMQGWSGAYSHSTGDRFFFKGGVTCPSSFFQLKIETGGDLGNPDYYGTDLGWFAGTSWSRPVFDLEGKAPGVGKSVILVNASYLVFDNLEIKNLFIPSGSTFAASSISVVYQHDILIKSCLIHDWTTNSTTDDQMGGVTTLGSPAVTVDSSTIYGPVVNGTKTMGACTFNVATVVNSTLHHCSNGVFGGANIHDNVIHDIGPSNDASYHENALEVGGATNVYVYNNVVYNCNHGTCVYPNPGNGSDVATTIYIYNNVVYNSVISNIQVDMWGQTSAVSSLYIYNNTLHCPGGNCVRLVPSQAGNIRLTNLIVGNNHYISDNPLAECWNAAGGNASCGAVANPPAASHNLIMTTADATAQGYTVEKRFAPTSAAGGTVDAGGDEPAKLFSKDVNGVARPQAGAWDVGAYEFQDCNCRLSNQSLPVEPAREPPAQRAGSRR